MTLIKARELLQMDIDDPGSVPTEDLNQAKEIAIEAIKRILFTRMDKYPSYSPLLPGETKE